MARILIVDDEESIRFTLGEFLRDDGHTVVEAEDAGAALRQLGEAEFDVVVADIVLPRVSGVELLRRIHHLAPHVQVVMMTGEPTVDTARESLRAGAADYVFKPISKAGILHVVGSALKLKALDDAKRRLEAENRAYQHNLERLVQERTSQLQASEERARELSRFNQEVLDALTAQICVLDAGGTILAVNRVWREFKERQGPLAVRVAVGANYLAACESGEGGSEALGREAAVGLRAVAAGESVEFTLEYSTGTPEAKEWFLLRATRFGGEGPARVVVARENITALKQGEENLRVAHERLRSFVDSNVVGVAIVAPGGRIYEANDYFLRLIGFTREELWRGRADWRALTPPEWLSVSEEALRRIREAGKCEPYEQEYVRRDGTRVPVLLADAMMPGPGEQIAVLALDQTERRHAQVQITEQLEELRRWQAVMLTRSDRSQELKREVNALLRRQGEPPRYASQEGDLPPPANLGERL